jgi:hypothetical protein
MKIFTLVEDKVYKGARIGKVKKDKPFKAITIGNDWKKDSYVSFLPVERPKGKGIIRVGEIAKTNKGGQKLLAHQHTQKGVCLVVTRVKGRDTGTLFKGTGGKPFPGRVIRTAYSGNNYAKKAAKQLIFMVPMFQPFTIEGRKTQTFMFNGTTLEKR